MDENITLKASEPKELAEFIVKTLYAKKAHSIKLLYVSDKTVITDYFVICTGNSNTQIKALADELEFKTGEAGLKPSSVEGFREASWIVLDYSSVIVHIFNRDTREFYNLEKLWSDGEEVDISEFLPKEETEEDE